MVGLVKKTMVGLSMVVVLLGASSCGGSAVRGTAATLDKNMEVSYFKAVGKLQVTDVTTDFYPTVGKVLKDPKDDGEQFVRVGITLENTGDELFKFNYTTVRFKNSAESSVLPTFLLNKGNVDDLLKSKELAKGEKADGALYFIAPEQDSRAEMSLVFEGYEGTTKKSFELPLE